MPVVAVGPAAALVPRAAQPAVLVVRVPAPAVVHDPAGVVVAQDPVQQRPAGRGHRPLQGPAVDPVRPRLLDDAVAERGADRALAVPVLEGRDKKILARGSGGATEPVPRVSDRGTVGRRNPAQPTGHVVVQVDSGQGAVHDLLDPHDPSFGVVMVPGPHAGGDRLDYPTFVVIAVGEQQFGVVPQRNDPIMRVEVDGDGVPAVLDPRQPIRCVVPVRRGRAVRVPDQAQPALGVVHVVRRPAAVVLDAGQVPVLVVPVGPAPFAVPHGGRPAVRVARLVLRRLAGQASGQPAAHLVGHRVPGRRVRSGTHPVPPAVRG